MFHDFFTTRSMIEFPTIFTWVTQPASLLKGKPNQKIPLTLISSFVAICLTNLSSFSCFYLLSSFSDQGVMKNLWLRNFSLFDTVSFLDWFGMLFFFGCCCRHMGSLKSMRYGSLIKAIYKFTMVRQNYGKWLFLLIRYCFCSWQYDWQLMGKQNEMWLFLDWIYFHNAVIRHFLPSIVVLGMVTNSKINLCI